MSDINKRSVYVVYNDTRKNMDDALRFGELKDVYANLGRHYNPEALIEHARRVFTNWVPGDYILMVGDPALCAICVAVALEFDPHGEINILRWNRFDMKYESMSLNFDYYPDSEGEDSANLN